MYDRKWAAKYFSRVYIYAYTSTSGWWYSIKKKIKKQNERTVTNDDVTVGCQKKATNFWTHSDAGRWHSQASIFSLPFFS